MPTDLETLIERLRAGQPVDPKFVEHYTALASNAGERK